ncbi:MAG: hypothetical protein JWP89_6191 [Schlesneria sp.]|nr:hypothetical protein [Schlesneria sp.]
MPPSAAVRIGGGVRAPREMTLEIKGPTFQASRDVCRKSYSGAEGPRLEKVPAPWALRTTEGEDTALSRTPKPWHPSVKE